MKKGKEIDAIIFDLGGVILNLDYQITIDAFEKLGIPDPASLFSQKSQTSFFDDFETGQITENTFLQEVKALIPRQVSYEEIINAWNAMLLDFPLNRFEFLAALKSEKRIFLLSNTNKIHMDWFKEYVNKLFGKNVFFELFEVAYLSNEIGLRKPNTEVFDYVISQNNLVPEKTLFIDDSPQHLEGAEKSGIQTIWLQKGEEITDVLPNFLA